VDVSKINLKIKIFDQEIDIPIGIAPSAMHQLSHINIFIFV